MRITVGRWDEFHLPRIAQLIQRSNQFNLATRRLTEVQCASLMKDTERWTPLYASLSDRLGDHGLISVVTCEKVGDELAIRDWLMSCRVLKRTVEQYLMTEVFHIARTAGLRRVTGDFIPTARNSMVSEFFAQFGFHAVFRESSGQSHWALDVAEFEPPVTYIKAVENAKVMAAV
jgi:FkbH-like protein